jgi:hypothetical protein
MELPLPIRPGMGAWPIEVDPQRHPNLLEPDGDRMVLQTRFCLDFIDGARGSKGPAVPSPTERNTGVRRSRLAR